MADKEKPGFFAKLFGKSDEGQKEVDQAIQSDFTLGYDGISVSTLLGSGKRQARSRAQIYEKWHYMMGDPIISTALRLHVTQALGGHETTGDTVFIEEQESTNTKAGEKKKIVEELQKTLAPIFNRIAHQVAFNGAGFGDSYGRAYIKDKVGITGIWIDEMIFPPLVQPYEKAGITVGYAVAIGQRLNERMTVKQLVRCKMPRMLYTPQMRSIDKSMRVALTNDNPEEAAILPALAGGSLLEAAEESFDNLTATLAGLVGQRILSSIDETMVGVNLTGTTKDQRSQIMKSITTMLTKSKERAEKAVKEGRPVTERIYHVMPTNAEKQLTTISQFNGASGATSITIDDVMVHARLLAGALGIDLSMLGFADQMSGGLGDGGFFRTSAQAAERSRIIRTALCDFFNYIVDLHTYARYGWVFPDGERPYRINFYGSISALEAEKQINNEKAANSLATLTQTLSQLQTLGMPKETNAMLLSKVGGLEEDLAEQLADGLDKAKPPGGDDTGGFGGGGFGAKNDMPTQDQNLNQDDTEDA